MGRLTRGSWNGTGNAFVLFVFVRDMSEMWKPKVIGLVESQKSGHDRVPEHVRKHIAVLEPNGAHVLWDSRHPVSPG